MASRKTRTRANVGLQPSALRLMAGAVIWALLQALVGVGQLSLLSEDGNPLSLQLCVRHAPVYRPRTPSPARTPLAATLSNRSEG
jgi:hypothetical protein